MLLVLGACAWVLLLAPARARAADDGLEYSAIDQATVRVFAFEGVGGTRVRGASGKGFVLAAPEAGHGSGLLVSADGLILTARHVVKDARLVAVQFPGDPRALPARVAYADPDHDHAFLVVDSKRQGFIEIPEHAPKLAVRQTVFVVGYPLDATRAYPQSQQGIVSGVLPDGSLQLGVALNPGNSGGPVVDAQERLLGIAVARADPRQGAQGIGVAVPVDHILPSYARLRKGGETKAARSELAQARARLTAGADLLAAMIATIDDSTWKALRGDKSAPETSPEIQKQLGPVARTGGADELSLLVAERWNAATVQMERGDSGTAALDEARTLARRAVELDASVTSRSPLLEFVLKGHGPKDVSAEFPGLAAAGEEEGEGSGSGQLSPREQLLQSLETRRSLPVWRVGPTLGLTAPFQIFGGGVAAKFLFGKLLNVDLRYQIGWHLTEGDTTLGHLGEGLVGIALGTWNGTTTAKLVVNTEYQFGGTVFHYVPGEVPTVHTLVAEAGAITGPVNLRPLAADADAAFASSVPEARQIYVLEAGLRYTYFYEAESDYLSSTAQSTVELGAHLLAPPLGVPSGSGNADGERIGSTPGFKVTVAWGSAPLSWGMSELGVGYLPSGDWIFARFGWSYLFD